MEEEAADKLATDDLAETYEPLLDCDEPLTERDDGDGGSGCRGADMPSSIADAASSLVRCRNGSVGALRRKEGRCRVSCDRSGTVASATGDSSPSVGVGPPMEWMANDWVPSID